MHCTDKNSHNFIQCIGGGGNSCSSFGTGNKDKPGCKDTVKCMSWSINIPSSLLYYWLYCYCSIGGPNKEWHLSRKKLFQFNKQLHDQQHKEGPIQSYLTHMAMFFSSLIYFSASCSCVVLVFVILWNRNCVWLSKTDFIHYSCSWCLVTSSRWNRPKVLSGNFKRFNLVTTIPPVLTYLRYCAHAVRNSMKGGAMV